MKRFGKVVTALLVAIGGGTWFVLKEFWKESLVSLVALGGFTTLLTLIPWPWAEPVEDPVRYGGIALTEFCSYHGIDGVREDVLGCRWPVDKDAACAWHYEDGAQWIYADPANLETADCYVGNVERGALYDLTGYCAEQQHRQATRHHLDVVAETLSGPSGADWYCTTTADAMEVCRFTYPDATDVAVENDDQWSCLGPADGPPASAGRAEGTGAGRT